MFVEARVVLGTGRRCLSAARLGDQLRPYGDSVFVVAEMPGPDGKPYRGCGSSS
jgi:hypothetical protein